MDPGGIAASKRMDDFLWDFSNKILPSDSFIKGGNMAVDKVFDLLKKESRFPLDRTYICGSVGKNTSIIFSDFDCVIFVNPEGVDPPVVEDILEDFKRIITRMPKVEELKKTEFSVQFRFEGFEIDLLPAINFAPAGQKPNMDILASEQAYQVFKLLEKEPSKSYKYSSSLCETNLKFIREQPEFVHRFARLVKFWNKTLYVDHIISGRSNTIELIGIYVAMKEKKAKGAENPSMVDTFKSFLGMMQRIRDLKIEFPDFDPLANLDSLPHCRGMKFGPRRSGSMEPPYVMEPSNPYNNMIVNFEVKERPLFERFAMVTLERMDSLLKSPHRDPSLIFNGMSLVLFEKFPITLPMTPELRRKLACTRFVSGINPNPAGELKFSTTRINKNHEKYKTNDMRSLFAGMLNYLETVVATAESKESLGKDVENAITVKFQDVGKQNTCAIAPPEFHQYDVNLLIPCPQFPGHEEPSMAIVGFNLP